MTIFLIGFMGSGKTTIGKGLANQLGCTFVDLDAQIELNEDRSIAEIFRVKGEEYFRKIEQKWLLNFNEKNVVVSVGGGTPCYHHNMNTILTKGISVYLNLPIGMMAKRVMSSKTIRPLIEPYRNDWNQLLDVMTTLFNKREPIYKQADIIFEASNMFIRKRQLLANMVKLKSLEKSDLLK
ncbi:MAG: shikimate kinase [Crocinitomicaceae bacterium]